MAKRYGVCMNDLCPQYEKEQTFPVGTVSHGEELNCQHTACGKTLYEFQPSTILSKVFPDGKIGSKVFFGLLLVVGVVIGISILIFSSCLRHQNPTPETTVTPMGNETPTATVMRLPPPSWNHIGFSKSGFDLTSAKKLSNATWRLPTLAEMKEIQNREGGDFASAFAEILQDQAYWTSETNHQSGFQYVYCFGTKGRCKGIKTMGEFSSTDAAAVLLLRKE